MKQGDMMARERLTVIQERGSHLESQHPIVAAVVDTQGRSLLDLNQDLVTTFRSSAKPFQLWGCLDLLSEEQRRDVTEQQLALGASSHSGEVDHVAGVRAILEHFALNEEEFLCGTHWPVHAQSAYAVAASGQKATAIHNNCSGKHAFMMAARKQSPPSNSNDYRTLEHPIQQAIYKRVNQASDHGIVDTVIDGCGVPCFVMSMRAMALTWARLAGAMAQNSGNLGRIGWAMHRHPHLMSGTGRLDYALVRAGRQPLVAKVGAEGVQCLAIPHLGIGVAIKVQSGASDPRAAASLAILEKVAPGLMDADVMKKWLELRNWEGLLVGRRYAQWND
ncbi:MAG TPA: asparaginase [Myxococcales bacterium]|nr:asparaginase [Myxococcales bacterium]HIN86066.1 asparaginase [Myxococcales bacterium]